MSIPACDDRDAADIHERVRTELNRLEKTRASRMEWLAFANRVVEAVMACQKIVIEHQSKLLAPSAASRDTEEEQRTRQASRDALHTLDDLSSLYEQVRAKLMLMR